MTDKEFITAIKKGRWSKNFIEKFFGKVRDKQDLLDLMIEEAIIEAYNEPSMMFDEHLVTISELQEPIPKECDNLWRATTFVAQHYGLTTGLEKVKPDACK